MKRALVLLNGIRFPFNLLNAALDWCKENKTALHAIFMKAEDEVKEGYIFPSDLDAAEKLNTTQDSEDASVRIIDKQVKLLREMAEVKDVPYSDALLTEPSLEEILTRNEAIDHPILRWRRRRRWPPFDKQFQIVRAHRPGGLPGGGN